MTVFLHQYHKGKRVREENNLKSKSLITLIHHGILINILKQFVSEIKLPSAHCVIILFHKKET